MNEFIISTKGSLWESSCPEHKGERQGSRKGGNMTGAEWILNNKYIYENGNIKLGLIKLKDIQDATDKFKQQIISEGKENYYIIAMADFGGTFTMQMLPIYGDPNKYVTKWFCSTPQGAIDSAKKDRRSVPATLLKGPVDENGNVISRQGSRKGSRKGLRYNWDGVPFEEIEYRLDSPVIDEDIYSMSDEELLQFAEDHGLRPEMFTNELPDWAQRDGSRKGSRKGKRIIHYGIGDYDVSDIDRYIAEGNVKKGNVNGDKHQIITYLMNEKGYSENDAWLTYDAWATHDNLVYGIPPRDYENVINKYREMVGLPPLEDSREGSRKGSRKGSSEDVWERFMGYENASDLQTFNKFCQVFQSVTGHPFDSDYGEEFDNENLAQQIVTKLDNELPGSRKGSRKGEAGDTDQSQLFIYLYEQDTTDNNTLRNMWNSLSSDEQDYILFQFGESRQDFEESFN